MPEGRLLSWSSDKTLRLWDASWPKGHIFEIACAVLPDKELDSLTKRYGIEVAKPICEPRAKIPLPIGSVESNARRFSKSRSPSSSLF